MAKTTHKASRQTSGKVAENASGNPSQPSPPSQKKTGKSGFFSLVSALLSKLFPGLFWLGLWQGVATALGQEILLPTPWVVGETLVNLASTRDFWRQLAGSLAGISAGICLGSMLGVALATLTWLSPGFHRFCAPALHTLQATPVVSFILLILLWLPRDTVPGTISALMVLPILWTNTKKGLEHTPGHLVEFARAYRFSPWQKCRRLYAPSLLPHLRAGLSVAVGLGWKSGVAAEVICRPPLSLGSQMSQSKLYFDTPSLLAYTIVVVILSALMERGVLRLIPSPRQ